MTTKQDIARFGQSLEGLFAILAQNMMKSRAQEQFQGAFEDRYGPTPPSATIPMQGGTATLPRVPLIEGRQFNPSKLPPDAFSNPETLKLIQGLLMTQDRVTPINQEGGGFGEYRRSPFGGSGSYRELRAPTIPVAKQEEKNAVTIDLDRPTVDVNGITYKWVQDVHPVTRKPVGEPRKEPWSRKPSDSASEDRKQAGEDRKHLQLEKLKDQFEKINSDFNDLEMGISQKQYKSLFPDMGDEDVESWVKIQRSRFTKQLASKRKSIVELEKSLGLSPSEEPSGIDAPKAPTSDKTTRARKVLLDNGLDDGEGAQGATQKPLDEGTASQILKEAGGNKEKARQIAKSRGYKF